MSNHRAGHAAKIIVHRIRQNWRWSKAHSWAHLIEEHDLNPLVRGRRAIRKSWWRLTQRDQKATSPAPLFLVGVQRSGTNLLAHGLDELPEFQVYNEGNTKAFENYRLRALPTIEALVGTSSARFVLFKPLCDSHRTVEMLDYFGTRGRAIWAYRSVDGRVRSAVAKFGDSNLRVLRAFAAGEEQKPWNTWQIEGLSAESAAFIRSFDFNNMSAESAAALFWYARNALYFELGLNQRPDITLVNYDEFLSEPGRIAVGRIVEPEFLGLGVHARDEALRSVRGRSCERAGGGVVGGDEREVEQVADRNAIVRPQIGVVGGVRVATRDDDLTREIRIVFEHHRRRHHLRDAGD